MEKVSVKVCLGTTCFVMGGGALQSLSEELKRRFAENVEVVGVTCLGVCNEKSSFSKAPFVKVGDVLVDEADFNKVATEVEKQIFF